MSPNYTLLYWGGIPGRGEYIRLAFEYTKTPYKNVTDIKKLTALFSPKGPHFAPPILDIDASATISQTPAILAYLAPKLGLAGSGEIEQAQINQLTLTALDLGNESHDVHHPIAPGLYYEDQKTEALRRAEDFRENRVTKFFRHFETVLSANGGSVLVGSNVSTADLTIYHVITALEYAFPKRLATLRKKGEYKNLFALKDRLGKELEEYLESKRRCEFGNGIFRHYPELDAD